MKKSSIFTSVATALTLSAGVALAKGGTEKCIAVNKEGKNLIKEHKCDCKTSSHSCAGQNKAGEADAWITVPKGQCDKIKAGDLSGVSKETKAKIEEPKAKTEAK